MLTEHTPTTSRHCKLSGPDECCDGSGMPIAREVPRFGPVYECMHCDRKLTAASFRPSSPPACPQQRPESSWQPRLPAS